MPGNRMSYRKRAINMANGMGCDGSRWMTNEAVEAAYMAHADIPYADQLNDAQALAVALTAAAPLIARAALLDAAEKVPFQTWAKPLTVQHLNAVRLCLRRLADEAMSDG